MWERVHPEIQYSSMALEINLLQAVVPHLNGYDHASMLMEKFLRSKVYWLIVEDGIGTLADGKALTNAQKTVWMKKAKNYVFAIERQYLKLFFANKIPKIYGTPWKKKVSR